MEFRLGFIFFFLISGCNYMERKGGNQPVTEPVVFSRVYSKILEPHCLGCHGPGGDLADLSRRDSLVAGGWVVPHSPEDSPLFVSVMAGRMPKGSPPLEDSLKELLATWIEQGAKGDSVPVLPPEEKTGFEGLLVDVLGPRCVGCHSGKEPKADLDLTQFDQVREWVIPGDPEGSDLIALVEEGFMPPGDNKLTLEQIETIKQWIRLGALERTQP